MLRTLTSRAREDREAGFTLIEILVAMVLMAIIMSSLAVFFIGANKSNSALRVRQAATVVADQYMDKVHSVDPTALLSMRAKTTEHVQWASQGVSVIGVDLTSTTNEDWDHSDLSLTDGPNAPLPDTPQTTTMNKTVYTTSIFVGQCWIPSGGGDCVKALPAGNPVSMERVVVAVNWNDKGTACPNHVCAYVIGSLVSTTGDPTFNLNQTIIDTTPPSTPTLGNGCTTLTDTKVNVNNWSQATDASGVARYDVYAGTSAVYGTMAKVGTSTGTGTFTVTGLVPSTQYFFVVIAVDTVGNPSGPQVPTGTTTAPPQPFMITCTTLPDTFPPNPGPAGLSATSTSNSVTVSWTTPASDEYKVAGYYLYRQGVTAPVATVGPTATSATDNGLSPWTTYNYTVRAFDPAGNLSPAAAISMQTTDSVAPTTPTLTAVAAASSLQINLTWTASTDDVAVTQYKVWRSSVSNTGPWTSSWTTAATVTAYTDTTGLTSNAQYWYYVTASDAKPNVSPPSNVATAKTPDTINPNAPTGLAGTPTGVSVALTWTAATDVAPGTGVVKYNVYRDGTLLTPSPTGTSFTDTGLANITTYTYTIKAVDGSGNVSASSTSLAVKTLDGTPPFWLTPPGLSFSSLTATSVVLSWAAATDNVAVTGYQLFRNGTMVGTTLGSTTLTLTDTGLTPGTTYTYVVKALDAAGNGGTSNTITPKTLPDTTAPSWSGTPLSFSSLTATSVVLSWTAAGDNVAVTGYQVFRNGTMVGTTLGSTTLTLTDTGLAPSTTYNYVVKALDAAGNLGTSNTVSPKTLADTVKPNAVTGLNGTSTSTTAVTINWNPGTDNVGVVSYTLKFAGTSYLVNAPAVSMSFTGLSVNPGIPVSIVANDAAGNVSAVAATLSCKVTSSANVSCS